MTPSATTDRRELVPELLLPYLGAAVAHVAAGRGLMDPFSRVVDEAILQLDAEYRAMRGGEVASSAVSSAALAAPTHHTLRFADLVVNGMSGDSSGSASPSAIHELRTQQIHEVLERLKNVADKEDPEDAAVLTRIFDAANDLLRAGDSSDDIW